MNGGARIAGIRQAPTAAMPALPGVDLGAPSLAPRKKAGSDASPFPGGARPTRLSLAIDRVGTDVPVGVAVGLGVVGLATGFLVAFGVFGTTGGRRRTVS